MIKVRFEIVLLTHTNIHVALKMVADSPVEFFSHTILLNFAGLFVHSKFLVAHARCTPRLERIQSASGAFMEVLLPLKRLLLAPIPTVCSRHTLATSYV